MPISPPTPFPDCCVLTALSWPDGTAALDKGLGDRRNICRGHSRALPCVLHDAARVRWRQEERMTPQETKLIDELFDRLASLENAPRDPEAVRAINEGLRRAPNALYPLVQTVLVQDEALKRADARIRELEGELGVEPGQPPQQGSFLDNMRDALLGKPQGSVPSVRPGATAP